MCDEGHARSLKPPALLETHDGLTAEQIATVNEANSDIQDLDGMRAVQINVSGHFARSKLAWKLAGYQHALLHRIVSIFDGAALAWNHRSPVAAMLCSRAMMETVAAFYALKVDVKKHLEAADLASLDALAHRGAFASRDKEWLARSPETQATNALTYVSRFDKYVPGFAAHYERLCERCHPNSLGHNFLFSELDRSDGTIRFVDERWQESNRQMVLAGVACVSFIKEEMPRLDRLIEAVADLQHRISPVVG